MDKKSVLNKRYVLNDCYCICFCFFFPPIIDWCSLNTHNCRNNWWFQANHPRVLNDVRFVQGSHHFFFHLLMPWSGNPTVSRRRKLAIHYNINQITTGRNLWFCWAGQKKILAKVYRICPRVSKFLVSFFLCSAQQNHKFLSVVIWLWIAIFFSSDVGWIL